MRGLIPELEQGTEGVLGLTVHIGHIHGRWISVYFLLPMSWQCLHSTSHLLPISMLNYPSYIALTQAKPCTTRIAQEKSVILVEHIHCNVSPLSILLKMPC